ncbi:glycosyltransferase family 4 protein [Thermodesulfobacteriota bacterium]
MKVLLWTELFWPHIGGVEVLCTQLMTSLLKRDYEFAVATSHTSFDLPDKDDYNDIPIYRFNFRGSLEARDLKQLTAARHKVAELKKSFKPDLIHINTSGPSILFHLFTRHTHYAPTLLTVHWLQETSFVEEIRQDTLMGRVLRSANWVSAVSAAALDYAHKLAPKIASRSSLILNGLIMPSVEATPLPFDAPCLLCLGRLVEEKGFDLALNAFALLTDRFPTARMIIAGEGPARPTLERLAGKLGLRDVIEFVGWVEPGKVQDLINTSTMVLMPSRWQEPFGLVALEAAQMARPVVATRVGGLPEVVMHQQTGLLVDKEDSAALTKAIAFLLDYPEKATQMGKAAQKRARKIFGWERFVDAYDDLYRKLINSNREIAGKAGS